MSILYNYLVNTTPTKLKIHKIAFRAQSYIANILAYIILINFIVSQQNLRQS